MKMYSSLFHLIFFICLSSFFRFNYCVDSILDNEIENSSFKHYKDNSFNQPFKATLKEDKSIFNYIVNHILNLFSNLKSKIFANHLTLNSSDNSSLKSNLSSNQLNQLKLINLIKKSNKFNLDNFKGEYYVVNQLKGSIKPTKLSKSSNEIFDKVYQSNGNHFCACPPKLKNAYHNLEDSKYDQVNQECIYLPMSLVEYHCKEGARKQNNNQFTINRLVCNLNDANRLEWILNVDEQFADLDERLIYGDQFTIDNLNETMEIKSQSTHLTYFKIEFLQCECKLMLFYKIGF